MTVTVHECEAFNDKDKGGNPIPGTFHQERYDRQFPGSGVPVSQLYDKAQKKRVGPNICGFCHKDVSNATPATEEQLAYMEGTKK